jgi:hypothetical protein
MGLQQVILEGTLAAAQLLALVVVPPVSAREAAVAAPAVLERALPLRRATAHDECDVLPAGGHVRLSEDERIADAALLAPDAEAVIATVLEGGMTRTARGYRVALPAAIDGQAPRALLLEDIDGAFLIVLPHRAASRATLVLRPAAGAAEAVELGRADARHAWLVRIGDGARIEDLAGGAIELELTDGRMRRWSTRELERTAATGPLAIRR